MNRNHLVPHLVLAAAALAAPAAYAADPPPEGVWTGKGQLGYVGTQGNTDSKSLNAALDMGEIDGPWKHAAHLGALYASQKQVTSASRWDAAWQSDYKFTDRLFGFGALHYLNDKFGGFQYQASLTGGVGYKIVDSDTFKLAGQVGAGYRKARAQVVTSPPYVQVLGDTSSNAIVTAGLDYWQQLTKTTTLTDKLAVESGSDNTLITNALALTVKMSDKLALSLGYAIQDNTKAVAPVKKLDSVETVNLVYSF